MLAIRSAKSNYEMVNFYIERSHKLHPLMYTDIKERIEIWGILSDNDLIEYQASLIKNLQIYGIITLNLKN